jgi:hypothetical protein
MRSIEIRHYTKNGIKLVDVELGNADKFVTLHEQDLDELLSLGATLPWKWRQEMAWFRNDYKDVNVARTLLNLDAGKAVRYRNSHSLDLTRGNLLVVNCMSKYNSRALLKKPRYNRPPRCAVRHVYLDEQANEPEIKEDN